MSDAVFQPAKADAFADSMVDVLNHGATALMLSLGHRSHLFDVMAEQDFVTSAGLAAAAGLSERYVREWLGAMLAASVVEYREADASYRLPTEHAACLTRQAAPNNLAAFMQYVSVLGAVEDQVHDAFQHGRGVPYSAYTRFHEVMAEDSAQTVVAALLEHILPLAPGLSEQLEQGLDVLDVGCGSGRALLLLAEQFPNSRFSGYDISAETIETAAVTASARGLSNLSFHVKDTAESFEAASFDLITAFDAIHDQAKPQQVLDNIRRALRPDGLFLMQETAASSHVHLNVGHPVGPFLYTISCMHCMSVSLAAGGPGLGAMWGRELALEMLAKAGFGDTTVEHLAHDFQNDFYLARPRGRVTNWVQALEQGWLCARRKLEADDTTAHDNPFVR